MKRPDAKISSGLFDGRGHVYRRGILRQCISKKRKASNTVYASRLFHESKDLF
jgi:hypothetical protein